MDALFDCVVHHPFHMGGSIIEYIIYNLNLQNRDGQIEGF